MRTAGTPGRMRAIAGAGIGAAALLGAALCAAAPTAVSAAPSLGTNCPTPSVTDVYTSNPAAQHGGVGSTVTVTGSNLDAVDYYPGCSTKADVTIGGTDFPNVATSNGAGSSLTFSLGQRADGPVVVTLTDVLGGTHTSNGNVEFVTDPSAGNLPGGPTVGQALSVSGTGLNLGGWATGASVSWATAAGSCPGSAASLASNGSSVSIPALGSFCQGSATLHVSWTSGTSNPGTLTLPLGNVDVTPVVSGSSPGEAPAGSAVTVHGSGFGSSGSARVGATAAGSSWSDTAVTVTLPDQGVGGAISLTRADGASIAGGTVQEDARIDSVAPLPAPEGATVTVTGGGFGPQGGSVTLGGAPLTASSWSPTTITFAVPVGATTGSVIVTPASGAAASARFAVAAVLKAITPTHGLAGTAFDVTGSGFGTSTGTVRVGATTTSVLLWGDGSIVAMIPSGVAPGAVTIVVQPPGENAVSVTFTVDAPPPPPPAGGGSSPSSAGSSSSSSSASHTAPPTPAPPSFIAPSADGPIVTTAPVPFQKPPAPTGPVSLTLTSSSNTADPGKDVALSVALVAFGKPVSGSQVDFLLVVEPGRDATLDPAEAVTDAAGHATTTLHLSATGGDTIVLARSGQYSDEVRVVSGTPAGAVAATGSTGGRGTDVIATIATAPPKAVVVGALVLCLVLFLSGFAIQVVLPEARRRHALAVAGGPGVVLGGGAAAGGGIAGRLVDAAAAAATVAQFAAALAIAAVVVPPALATRRAAALLRRR